MSNFTMTIAQHPPTPKTEKTYPRIMTTASGSVVLMESEECGTVLRKDIHNGVGHYSECWKMSLFKDYHGTITFECKGEYNE
jgi:hypothetical protein